MTLRPTDSATNMDLSEREYLDEYLADWRETLCEPESLSEAEEKVRSAVRRHLEIQAEHDRKKSGAVEALASEAGFSMMMLKSLLIRKVRHLRYGIERRLDAIEQRLDSIAHEDGRRIASPRLGDNTSRARAVVAMPVCKGHQPGKVYYAGELVTSSGSTYQANCDTGQAPPHEDWTCIAAAGGAPTIQGTFDPKKSSGYRRNSLVVLNGASFIALRDAPGPCPGPGWQLMAGQGRRGQSGERGPAGPSVRSMTFDDKGVLTLINSDGSVVRCDMYPVLSRIDR